MKLLTMFVLVGLVALGWATPAAAEGDATANPMVEIKTNRGDIVIELYPDKAPITVENFLRYADEGFYDGTIFHRVIRGFMIQGGGFDAELTKSPTHEPIKNEADNGLTNDAGTIAMARTGDVNSATAQFFINTADNAALNHGVRDFGYAVFGRVTEGMDVVTRIEASRKTSKGPMTDLPADTVVIESVSRRE